MPRLRVSYEPWSLTCLASVLVWAVACAPASLHFAGGSQHQGTSTFICDTRSHGPQLIALRLRDVRASCRTQTPYGEDSGIKLTIAAGEPDQQIVYQYVYRTVIDETPRTLDWTDDFLLRGCPQTLELELRATCDNGTLLTGGARCQLAISPCD